MKFLISKDKGFVTLLTVSLILSVGLMVGLPVSLLIWNEQKITRNAIKSAEAYYAAEAGLEDNVYRVIKNKKYEAANLLAIGENQTESNIISATNQKIIESKGMALQRTRKLKTILNLATNDVTFHYGAQVGEGGIRMNEHSRIEGTGGTAGNLYSNGPVVGDSDATITGDATVATGISLTDQFLVCNTDQITGKSNSQIDFAQSFKATASKPLAKISLYIKKVGSPGDISIKITNDASGSPAQTSIASATLQASLVGTSYAWIDIVFSSPPNLMQNNTYWLIVNASQNSSKYWLWCKDNNNGYTNGLAKYSQDWDNDPWTGINGDLNFKIYLGTGLSSIDNVTVYGTVRANAIKESKICGDAYYQSTSSIDSNSKQFLDAPSSHTCPAPLTPGAGYPNQSDPPVSAMPISQANINQWKSEAENGGVINGNYNATNDISLGPKKITGDLNLTSNNKILTVTGTIYVQGNIEIDNGSTIRCDASYNTNSCVIITDGWIHVSNNGVFSGSGQPGSYLMLLTTLSGCNGGSPLPQCTNHNAAIDLHNNATGAIFYTADSLAYIHNGINITEITAYKLELANNAIVAYEQGLANAQFTNGPGTKWSVGSWKEIE